MIQKTAEDNLNIALKDITVTGRDGRVSQLDQVYIRGSMVRFFIVPDMLQNAPMSVPFPSSSLPPPRFYTSHALTTIRACVGSNELE